MKSPMPVSGGGAEWQHDQNLVARAEPIDCAVHAPMRRERLTDRYQGESEGRCQEERQHQRNIEAVEELGHLLALLNDRKPDRASSRID